jgi:hypothetical protein
VSRPVSVTWIGVACGVHAGKNRGIMAVALVQGGRDSSADRLETAWAAAFQRCGDVEFLADRQLAASSGCDAPGRRRRIPGG